MKLEAVTVCIGYADFLAETVVHNQGNFDRWVIVTSPDDRETIELCRRRNLQVVTTTDHARDGKFNKGRAISLGLNYLSADAWVLHLDADVVLPNQARQMLEVAHLDPTCIYGADRICLQSWDEWQELLRSGYLNDQHGYQLCCNPYLKKSIGTRVIRGRHGYVPIGFFQLWNYRDGVHSGFRWKDYPDSNDDAAHSDIKFSLHWDRRKRLLLPEIIVVHLESAPSGMGANWKGRTTPRFGPPPAGVAGTGKDDSYAARSKP
jgi:hypothetical protein